VIRRIFAFLAATLVAGAALAQTPDPRVVSLEIKAGKVAVPGGTVRVTQGDTIELRVASDVADEIHLHGYDLTFAVTPGETSVVRFVARVAGRFPISSHRTGGRHSHRTLAYLEVHPR
jgi:FtsP/CotA-like multicopper oxidase with cupredoxin domain